jgi:hypothetical protein
MDEYVLESVEERVMSRGGKPAWAMNYRKPDGTIHMQAVPKETIDWRMAEYQVDQETAIQMILGEPWVKNPEDPVYGFEDAAREAGMRSVHGDRVLPHTGKHVPVTLWTAKTVEEARQAHLVRLQYVWATRVRVVSTKQRMEAAGDPEAPKAADPLDVLRSYKPDKERMKHMGDIVLYTRQSLGLDLDKPRIRNPRSRAVDPMPPRDPAFDRREVVRRRDPKDEMYDPKF